MFEQTTTSIPHNPIFIEITSTFTTFHTMRLTLPLVALLLSVLKPQPVATLGTNFEKHGSGNYKLTVFTSRF